jgi:hypothetical protein
MSHFHAVVWIDHAAAHVVRFGRDDAVTDVLHAKAGHRQVHHRTGTVGAGKAHEDPTFCKAVADTLRESGEILLCGPAQAKLEPAIADHVVGLESSDHPTDGQLLKHARHYFEAADNLRAQE